MTDRGYTATEALAALAIIGLAMGGLASGMQVIGRAQSAISATVVRAGSIRAASLRLDQLFADEGPFRSDQPANFQGDGAAFSFTCGTSRCGARLQDASLVVTRQDGSSQSVPLPADAKPKFLYGGSQQTTENWPPPPLPSPAPPWETLQFVTLGDAKSGQAAPLVVSRLWVQQPANCDYDAIIQDCRAVGP